MDRMSVEMVAGEPPRPRARRSARALALVAAVLVLLGSWLRGHPAFLAWELARDHQRCFGRRQLPARVWTSEASEVRAFFESRGTPTPPLPSHAHAAELVGARYCPLEDRVAAHVYYGGDEGTVSIFLLSGPARVGDGWAGLSRGLHVRLLRAAGRVLAIVGDSEVDVEATARAFETTVAAAPFPAPPVVDRPRPSC